MKTAGSHSKKLEVPVKGVRSIRYSPFREIGHLERKKKKKLDYFIDGITLNSNP